MSKPSRLLKPSKQLKKDPPGNRTRMLIIGERLMRAGSEGDLTRPSQQQPSSSQDQSIKMLTNTEVVRGEQRPSSAEDVVSVDRRQVSKQSGSWSSRTLPRRHTASMQTHSLELRREAFLEQLKQRFPQHTSTFTSHQERLPDQIRGSGQSGSPLVVGGDQACVEMMSEGEAPAAFTRGSRARASLPALRPSNHTQEHSLGVLYLQYGEETRQILMPSEVTSVDTVRALFVSAFPQQLSLPLLDSPNTAIYIKDHAHNLYYQLTDIRSITPHSCLKVYHKDPAQAFNHTNRNNNGDARISRERLYGTRQASGQTLVQTLPVSHSSVRGVQGSMSPPAARSMPSSPSRLAYGPRGANSSTLPRERLSSAPPARSSAPPARSSAPCSGAILERRDVKPDEDVGVGVAPYEGRLSLASSQDLPDGPVFLPQRYPEGPDAPQHSLYRQKSRKYSENQLGPKTPPPSPHRMGEVRMIDIHPSQNAQPMERVSPVRRSFRKNSNGTMEAGPRVRGGVASPVFSDLPPGHGDRPFQDPQSERMKAMEQQIASLTGLVQHALLKGTNTSSGTTKETISDKPLSVSPAHSINSGGVSPVAVCKSPALQTVQTVQTDPPAPQAPDPAFSSILTSFQHNVSSLRQQLHQLRHMQMQNQETVRLMFQQAEEELLERLFSRLQLLDDPLQKQRTQVDQERHRYLSMEESVLIQLRDLEEHVEKLQRDSVSSSGEQLITLRDVEDGAVNLRKVGEALATLKGDFPALQLQMRSVLKVEVEAVRFLKEEPHKMDGMLKRVKTLTNTLSSLRRCATEGSPHTDLISTQPGEPAVSLTRDSPTPQPRSPAPPLSSSPGQLSHHPAAGLSHHPAPPLTPTHTRDTPTIAKVSPRSREHSPALQRRSSRVLQEAHNSTQEEEADREQCADEARSEMERILQQTQLRLMKAIPDLQVMSGEESSTNSPPPHHVTLPDEVDSPQHPAPNTEAPAEPVADKPVQLSAVKPHKPVIEKPHRASVERVKSPPPPPPPPRRLHPHSPGLTTTRSGEVIYTSRKDSSSAQQEEENIQPKAQRVPPEVKPKPQPPPPTNTTCSTTSIISSSINTSTCTSSSTSTQDEEDHEEDKIIAELQVFEKCPVKDLEPRFVLDLTTHKLPDPEASFSLSSYDPKNTAQRCEDGKDTPRSPPGSGVIYYITGTSKIPSDGASKGPEVLKEPKEGVTSKVAHPNASDFSQPANILTSPELTLDPVKSVKEAVDAQLPASLPKLLKETSKAEDGAKRHQNSPKGKVPKGQLAERVTSRSEQQVVLTCENQSNATCRSEAPAANSQVVSEVSVLLEENKCQENEQQVLLRSSRGRARYTEDASLSPDLPGEEAPPPPPPDNIAFMITKTRVKALSNGEYQQLVNSKGKDVETVKVGTDTTMLAPEDGGSTKKPVIIFFDEPMDIQQAYKRLSTIFECEEELDKMLSKETIVEEVEEEEAQSPRTEQVITETRIEDQCKAESQKVQPQSPTEECSSPDLEDGPKLDLPGDAKQDAKKKFKFKFPKKQLAAIGQALRTGTKTGKKTLQVVVYEDEEEPDGTIKQAREAKRYEIKSQADSPNPDPVTSVSSTSQTSTVTPPVSKGRSNEICKTTYKTLDSLEETIKQLETTISDMDPTLSPEASRKDLKIKRSAALVTQSEGSPSKRPTPQASKPHKTPQRKKSKSQSSPRPSSTSTSSSTNTKQNASDSPSSSRVSSPRSRQQTGSSEKPGKPQKLQDSQRQFRQANGSASTARSNSKNASLVFPLSKIPAFCPSAGKSSSIPVSNVPKPKTNHPSSPKSPKSSIPYLSLSQSPTRTSPESLRVPGPGGQSSSSSPSSSSSSSVSPTSSSSSSPSPPSLLSPIPPTRSGPVGSNSSRDRSPAPPPATRLPLHQHRPPRT